MAIINKLVSANPSQGRNRNALDNTLVKYGDLNQVISEADTAIEKNATSANDASSKANLALEGMELVGNKVNNACTQYSSCAEAAAAGVAVGTFFSLVKTFKLQNGEETQDCSIPVIVCMPLDCEGLCW